MHDLNRLLYINHEIQRVLNRIEICECRNTAPKNQTISDMPKGGSRASNEIEDYLEKKEQLCSELDTLIVRRTIHWCAFLNQTTEARLNRRERELLKLHYIDGLKWVACAETLDSRYPSERWNENKVFRTLRSIMHKIKEKNCAVY